jgi:hypothetical protein
MLNDRPYGRRNGRYDMPGIPALCFQLKLFWAEEFCRYGLVWSTFVSIGYCIRHNLMLRMDSLDKFWPRRIKIALNYALKLSSMFFWWFWERPHIRLCSRRSPRSSVPPP